MSRDRYFSFFDVKCLRRYPQFIGRHVLRLFSSVDNSPHSSFCLDLGKNCKLENAPLRNIRMGSRHSISPLVVVIILSYPDTGLAVS